MDRVVCDIGAAVRQIAQLIVGVWVGYPALTASVEYKNHTQKSDGGKMDTFNRDLDGARQPPEIEPDRQARHREHGNAAQIEAGHAKTVSYGLDHGVTTSQVIVPLL